MHHPRSLPLSLTLLRTLLFGALLFVLFAVAAGFAGAFSFDKGQAPVHTVRVLETLPHDRYAFTQGLFWHRGELVESTGRFGASTIRRVNAHTGEVLLERRLPDNRFGEGAAQLGDTVLQLTWKSETGYLRDLETLETMRTFRYSGEGWGLASMEDEKGRKLVMSDGSAKLTFLSPQTLTPIGTITVRDGNREIDRLNELEWVRGQIWCNIWLKDEIAVVNPETGAVEAFIDIAPLRKRLGKGAETANGIAYDPETDRLLVTGKLWDHAFEIAVEPPLE